MARCWFQFSLRRLLIAVIVLAVALGWKAEQARSRGRAIRAIVDEYGYVGYSSEAGAAPDFFQDLWLVPVDIELQYSSEAIIAQVVATKPVGRLGIFGGCTDIKSLERLNELNDGCEIEIEPCTAETGELITRLLPRANVRWYQCPTIDTPNDGER